MHPSPNHAGRTYHVHEVLGQGGFGTVYRAELVSEGGFTKTVALKVLHDHAAARTDHVERLRDEARMLGLVRHRALIGADALVRLEDQWTVVMEYVPGVSLRSLQKRFGALPEAAVIAVGAEVADALDAAFHAELEPGKPLQLVHRDVKPSNLQLTARGEVKVLDFGVARAEFDRREARTQQVVYGSPPYLAPERLEGVDRHRGDIFALGISLAELVSGRSAGPVVVTPTGHAARVDALLEDVDLRPGFLDLLRGMLAYEHADRPDAAEVRGQLRPWSHDDPDALVRYAAEFVPLELRARGEMPGELSGRKLREDTTASVLQRQALATWEEGPKATEDDTSAHGEAPDVDVTWDVELANLRVPPDPAPGATPQRRRRRWLVVGLLVLASFLGVVGVVGLGGMASVSWAMLSFLDDRGCEGAVAGMKLDLARAQGDAPWPGKTRSLVRRAEVACARDEIGLIEASLMANELENAMDDRRLDQQDYRAIEAHLLEYLPDDGDAR